MSDVAAPAPPVPDSDTRIEALERSVATLENLINDVMEQLYRPFRDQHSKQDGTLEVGETEAHATEVSSITRRSATTHQRGTEAGRQGSCPQVPESNTVIGSGKVTAVASRSQKHTAT